MEGPAVRFRHSLLMCILVLAAMLGAASAVGAAEATGRTALKGGCPDLIDLIRKLAPVVVNISIERDMVQKSSTGPPPLFRSRPGRIDDQGRVRERFQAAILEKMAA